MSAVSVIIPTYNRASTVRRSIDSVLSQTYTDFELVVVDDASTDDTLAVLRSVDDPRVRVVVSPKNTGAAGARNIGLENVSGEWVAFQDSDDVWLPWKLERQMARLEAEGGGWVAAYCGLLVLGGLDAVAGDRLRLKYVPDPAIELVDGDILSTLLRTNVISTQTLVVRLEAIREVGGFDSTTDCLEDWDCAISLARRGRIAFIDEPLVHQTFSPNSITRDVDRRVLSASRVVAKHHDVFSADGEALARQYYVISGGYRRLGQIEKARFYMSEARRLRRSDPKIAAMSILLAGMARRRSPGES